MYMYTDTYIYIERERGREREGERDTSVPLHSSPEGQLSAPGARAEE